MTGTIEERVEAGKKAFMQFKLGLIELMNALDEAMIELDNVKTEEDAKRFDEVTATRINEIYESIKEIVCD